MLHHHDFELIADYLNIFTSDMCFRIYLWLVDHPSYYHQFLFAGLRGYPAVWIEMWVVVGSPLGHKGMQGEAGNLMYKKWQL